jgi:hypothetical protein
MYPPSDVCCIDSMTNPYDLAHVTGSASAGRLAYGKDKNPNTKIAMRIDIICLLR